MGHQDVLSKSLFQRGGGRVEPATESEDAVPQFRFLASEMSLASSGRMGSVQAQALKALREAFTPTQPKQSVRLFAGRRRELKRIVSAIEEWKAHIVIFGERGYGKSSLANIVAEIAKQGGISVLSCSCSAELTFEEMFRNFLREIPLPYRGVPTRGEAFKAEAARAGGNFAQLLPAGAFGATELAETLRHLTDRHVIFRIDEFDRVRGEEIKNQIAEAIKNLSDVGARVTFLIVGVADDLDELLGKHPSIQRNVVGVHLSLMTEAELLQLIKAGEKAADIGFQDEVRGRIVALAQGLPYQAQLLCQQAGQVAIEEGAKTVGPQHLARAIDQAIALAPRGLERLYDQAFAGPNHDSLKAVAFAAALSPCDPWGYFCVQDLARAQRTLGTDTMGPDTIGGLLDSLADSGRSQQILRLRQDRAGRYYAYSDPLLRAYILLRLGREYAML
jgi:Cdc6-like AAA superfamily ATPase